MRLFFNLEETMRKTERVLMKHPYTTNAAIFYDTPHQERVFLRIEMQNAVHYLGTSRSWNLRVNMMLEYAKLSSKQIIAQVDSFVKERIEMAQRANTNVNAGWIYHTSPYFTVGIVLGNTDASVFSIEKTEHGYQRQLNLAVSYRLGSLNANAARLMDIIQESVDTGYINQIPDNKFICNIKALKACEKTTRYNGKTYTLYDFRDCSFNDRSLYSQASRMYYQPNTPVELIQMINERVDREVHYKIADRY